MDVVPFHFDRKPDPRDLLDRMRHPLCLPWLLQVTLLYQAFDCQKLTTLPDSYLIDCYLQNAASALAINTGISPRKSFTSARDLTVWGSIVFRSSFGAGFPLFAGQMYRKLGTPGASSLLGGLAVVFIPVPFLLMKYGKKIRGMSKNAIVRENE